MKFSDALRSKFKAGMPSRSGVQSQPFSILLDDLSLPAVGAAAVTADTFLFMPHDTGLDAVYVVLSTAADGTGTFTVQLVQSVEDGAVTELTNALAMDGSETDPVQLDVQQDVIEYSRPVYLRISASAPSTGSATWFTTTGLRLYGTLHLYTTD